MLGLGGGTGKRDGVVGLRASSRRRWWPSSESHELLLEMLSLRWSSTNWPLSTKAPNREVQLIRSDNFFVRI